MIEKLMREKLEWADVQYAKGTPEMSDIDYDLMKSEFKSRFPNSPYNDVVGLLFLVIRSNSHTHLVP